MIKINPYLFVYGTLLNKKNHFGAFLHESSSFVGNATFRGKLYDMGEYPGAIAVEKGDYLVYGQVFILKNPEETLKILDDYEGFGESHLQPNLFVRELVNVETNDTTMECWVYLCNLPVDGKEQIVSGRYGD